MRPVGSCRARLWFYGWKVLLLEASPVGSRPVGSHPVCEVLGSVGRRPAFGAASGNLQPVACHSLGGRAPTGAVRGFGFVGSRPAREGLGFSEVFFDLIEGQARERFREIFSRLPVIRSGAELLQGPCEDLVLLEAAPRARV
jgi:hypothetical protein